MFNPRDWYWYVGGDTAQAYSSKRNIYVDPASDADYAAWAAANGPHPAAVANESEIWFYLKDFAPAWLWNGTTMSQPTPTTWSKEQLAGYAADARFNRASAGIIITSLSPVAFLSDPVSRNAVNSAHDYVEANPAATVKWKMSDGSFVQLDKTTLTSVMMDMSAYVESCFAGESNTADAINAGSITTLEEIDDAFAAISNTFP
jgi:ferric-dicitrate binding protein FerR (iron transport regulator)